MKNVPFQTKIFGLVLAFLPLLVVLGGCETTAGPAEPESPGSMIRYWETDASKLS